MDRFQKKGNPETVIQPDRDSRQKTEILIANDIKRGLMRRPKSKGRPGGRPL